MAEKAPEVPAAVPVAPPPSVSSFIDDAWEMEVPFPVVLVPLPSRASSSIEGAASSSMDANVPFSKHTYFSRGLSTSVPFVALDPLVSACCVERVDPHVVGVPSMHMAYRRPFPCSRGRPS
jgi:hypothetical protein